MMRMPVPYSSRASKFVLTLQAGEHVEHFIVRQHHRQTAALGREVGEKGLHLDLAHGCGMPQAAEADESAAPLHVACSVRWL